MSEPNGTDTFTVVLLQEPLTDVVLSVAAAMFVAELGDVTHVFQEDAISDRERDIFRKQLRRDLAG